MFKAEWRGPRLVFWPGSGQSLPGEPQACTQQLPPHHLFTPQVPTAVRLGAGWLPCNQIDGLIAGPVRQSYRDIDRMLNGLLRAGGRGIAFGSDLIKKTPIFLIILPATAGAGPEAGSLATAHPADKELWGEDTVAPGWPSIAAISPAHRPARGGWWPGRQLPAPLEELAPPFCGPPPPTSAALLLAEPPAWHSPHSPSPAAQLSPVSCRSPTVPALRLGCPHVSVPGMGRSPLCSEPASRGGGGEARHPPPISQPLLAGPFAQRPIRIPTCTFKPCRGVPPARP